MQIESALRKTHPLAGFVYTNFRMYEKRFREGFICECTIRPRKRAKPLCGICGKKCPGYDTLKERRFDFVPFWGMSVYLLYAMRRVTCLEHGVVVERVPWASGKSPMTYAMMLFVASWAKLLSWKETSRRFGISWDSVFRAVEHVVTWGLANRDLDGIRSIGVDELSYKKGQKYITMVYQIDLGCRRLLHIAEHRTKDSFRSFFDMIGNERSQKIEFVASDMWKPFRSVIKERCGDATHVLDRFHIMQHMSKAIDETRRQEMKSLRASGREAVLTGARWLLLKRKPNLKKSERVKLRDLVSINLRSVRAYLLKEQFQHFWTYRSELWARRFLDGWIRTVNRSRIEPMKKFAKTLRNHEDLLFNWFKARNQFAAGATEGFNNKARITTRNAYGFRTYRCTEIALYHSLGKLPDPNWVTHRFY